MATSGALATQSRVETDTVVLRGGLDLVTPALATPAGRCIAAVNYEAGAQGYTRFAGFERFDGQLRPSESSYWVLHFVTGTAAISAGDIVVGGTSAAQGKALYTATVESGSYGGSNAAGYVVLAFVSGDFVTTETLKVLGVTKSVSSGLAIENGAESDENNATWSQAAIEAARTLIQQVPGSGNVTGAALYAGALYAFREDSLTAPTLTRMYKSTASGWELQDLGRYAAFTSGGTYELVPGNTIIGASSGATALIVGVVTTSGTYAGGTATGFITLINQSGNFTATENLNVGANLNVATITTNSIANALLPGGTFKGIVYNFYGDANAERAYFVDGVNPAFEWDGVVMLPISAQQATPPIDIAAHKERLWLAFDRGMLDGSVLGVPVSYDGTLGAVEFGLGSDITGLMPEYVNALIVFCADRVKVLYGNDAADFDMQPVSTDVGALKNSIIMMDAPVFFDDRGLRDLRTTQSYGNFIQGSLTELIKPLLEAKRKAGVSVTCSMRVRRLDIYRIFFDDDSALSVYFGNPKMKECMVLDLTMPARGCCTGKDGSLKESAFFYSDDGYIYQMDAGTSFDGEELSAYVRLAFNASKSPNFNKRYQQAIIETDANPSASLAVTAAFSYGDPDLPAVAEQDFTVQGGGGFWDEANWNETYWDNPVKGRALAYIDGLGFNISMTIGTQATYERQHTIHGLILTYSMRGRVKV